VVISFSMLIFLLIQTRFISFKYAYICFCGSLWLNCQYLCSSVLVKKKFVLWQYAFNIDLSFRILISLSGVSCDCLSFSG